MISLVAIVPYTPLLIDSITPLSSKLMGVTRKSYKAIRKELAANGVETLLMISPHAPVDRNMVSFGIAKEYHLGFKQFGDLITQFSTKTDLGLFEHLRSSQKDTMGIIDSPELDYTQSIPLYRLLEPTFDRRSILSLYLNDQSSKEQLQHFSQWLEVSLQASHRRIAIIICADAFRTNQEAYKIEAQQKNNELYKQLSNHEVIKVESSNEAIVPSSIEKMYQLWSGMELFHKVKTVPLSIEHHAQGSAITMMYQPK